MAEEQQQQPTAQAISEPQVSQVTSQTPATRPAKNPKRVAAGKMVAERPRVAREAQKKAVAEASAIIAREKEKNLHLLLSRFLRPHQSPLQLIPKFQMV